MPKTPYQWALFFASLILIVLALLTIACVWAAGIFSLIG